MDASRSPQMFRVIGRRTPKVDALDKVTGRAQFGADVTLPRMLVGKVLRSPYAHARITRIDTSKAAAFPGVKAVITGQNLSQVRLAAAGDTGSVSAREYHLSREILARDKVLFHGHVVAAVAATSNAIAAEAVGLIEVEYAELPHVTEPVAAMQPEAVLLHADLYTQSATGKATTPSNVVEHLEMGRGDVARGFAEADVVVERAFRTQVVHQGYLEPDSEAALANAIYRAVGVRLRELPMTPERLHRALQQDGGMVHDSHRGQTRTPNSSPRVESRLREVTDDI